MERTERRSDQAWMQLPVQPAKPRCIAPGLCPPLKPPSALAWSATQAPYAAPLPAAATGLAATSIASSTPAASAMRNRRIMGPLQGITGTGRGSRPSTGNVPPASGASIRHRRRSVSSARQTASAFPQEDRPPRSQSCLSARSASRRTIESTRSRQLMPRGSYASTTSVSRSGMVRIDRKRSRAVTDSVFEARRRHLWT